MMKFRKPLVAVLAACTSMLLMLSCGDTVVESEDSPIVDYGALHVVVRDNSNGTTESGAKVTLHSATSGDKSLDRVLTTPVGGAVTFDNLHFGDYSLLIEKAGFTTVVQTARINRNSVTYVAGSEYPNHTVEAGIYPLTAKLSGNLYYTKDGIREGAVGAEVRVMLNDENVATRIYKATTTAGGAYSFAGLPAVDGDYTLTALEFTPAGVSKTYRVTPYPGTVPALKPDATEHAVASSTFLYTKDVTPFEYLGETTVTVAGSAPLTLLFSDSIAKPVIVSNPVSISPAQPFVPTYAGDKVVITPMQNWNKTGGITVTISTDLISTKGNNLESAVNITVKVLSSDLTVPVTGLILDSIPNRLHDYAKNISVPHYYSTLVNLKWRKVAGDVDGYEVFYKPDGKKAYEPAAITWISPDNFGAGTADSAFKFATVRTNGGEQIQGSTNTFVVQAVNGLSRSALVGADTVLVFSKPTLTAAKGSYVAVEKIAEGNPTNNTTAISWAGGGLNQEGFERWLYTALLNTTASRQTFTLTFTEQMNFATNPVGTWSALSGNPDATRVSVSAQWGDSNLLDKEYKLTVTVDVAAGTAVALPTTVNDVWGFSFSGITSQKGKPFFIEYTDLPAAFDSQGITKVIKPTLDFKIKARI